MSRLSPKWSLITQLNPKSPISESYRTLRTNLEYSSINQKLQMIMFTSSKPGEGKSTTCANVAVAFAQANKRVLLIDADLRKPTQHFLFGTSNRNGLTSALLNRKRLDDIVQHTVADNLFIVHAGATPPNPSELLASPQMAELLEEARADYDIIIVDTPPIVSVTDAQIVAAMSDGVLLLVDSGGVSKELVLKSKSLLDHVNARLLGVVLNNVNRSQADSYSYYYGAAEG